MIPFRKKIYLFDIILLCLFLSLLYPLIGGGISRLMQTSYGKQIQQWVDEVADLSIDEVKKKIEQEKLFLEASLYNKEKLSSRQLAEFSELRRASRGNISYKERYSPLFKDKVLYVAIPATFQNVPYILHAQISLKEIKSIQKGVQGSFLLLSLVIVVFYSLLSWFLISRLSTPIERIIESIRDYREGREEFLPQIELQGSLGRYDEFGKLANTLNSLSAKIQHQIESLTYQKNEHESILNSLVEGVLAVNSQNVITYANQTACKMLSDSSHRLVGNSLLPPLHEKDSQLVERCHFLVSSCQKEGKSIKDSFVTGREESLYLDILAIPRAFKSGAVLVLQDKTSDYKMLQMGKEFIANASHELKTPLTIIRGFAETLHDRKELTAVQQKEVTKKIVSTCERLNTLVQNLLMLADIENLPSTPSTVCNLLPIVENCRHMISQVHKKADITLEHSEEEYLIYGDLPLLEHAIMNVMDNAIKYSSPSIHIFISLSKKEEEILLAIQDEGIGIPKEDLPHIFSRFYTVDKARSRKFGGAGLGLSIVKTILEKHKAKVEVTSEVNRGTTFTFTFTPAKISLAQGRK